MAKVSEWLGLYLWMNKERLTEIEAKMYGNDLLPEDRARIISALQEQQLVKRMKTGVSS